MPLFINAAPVASPTFTGTVTFPDGSTETVAGLSMAVGKTITPASLAGVAGTTTNDNANAGSIGEILFTTVASPGVTLTTGVTANVTSVALTAGDWDVSAQVDHAPGATTSITLIQIGISATTATMPSQLGGAGIGPDPSGVYRVPASVPGAVFTTAVGPVRVSLAIPTTIFLVVADSFTVSTMTAFGTIRARRIR